jgi:hypothetical protein
LPEAVRLIVELVGPRRIFLYGSLATGLFLAAHSDVDLAVEGMGHPPDDAKSCSGSGAPADCVRGDLTCDTRLGVCTFKADRVVDAGGGR